MGSPSGTSFNKQPLSAALPLRSQPVSAELQASLYLVPRDACGSPENQDPGLNHDQVHASPSESASASSRGTWPGDNDLSKAIIVKVDKDKEEGESESKEQSVVRRVCLTERLSLCDIARDRIDMICEKLHSLPQECHDELKNDLRVILEGTGGSLRREEFLLLQRLVQSRSDLMPKMLSQAHRVQLEILVAIKTGIQAFLHPNISLSQAFLIEIFLYKRCRNIACQSPLPADDCSCEVCANRNGFCNLCMCVICSKFDFEVNTCRWIGCDLCSHWTHTDCAIRSGHIGAGSFLKCRPDSVEMLFKCQACNGTSELLGWVKDVFQHCAPGWDREALTRELDFVSRIFRGSEDPRGLKLHWKCQDLIEKMTGGVAESTAWKMFLSFFQELENDHTKLAENEENGRLVAPQEACNRIAEVVQEAVRKMEMVAEEKMRMFKKARLALEACDKELEDKAQEVSELRMERQRKKQQIEELESIVRLKQAEADMFQAKASEARREAERLQRIALAKPDKSEKEYTNRYLELRLNEAEAEKQYLFEKIKLQESARASYGSATDPSQMLMLCKLQDFLKNMYNIPSKSEGQSSDCHPLGSVP